MAVAGTDIYYDKLHTTDGKAHPILERVTGGFKIVNSDHAYIHEGGGRKLHLVVGALNAEATVSYSFTTAADVYVHLKTAKLQAVGAGVKLEIFRGTASNPLTIDSAGAGDASIVGPHNLSDVSTKVPSTVVKKTPTYTDNETGELWERISVLGSSTNQFVSVSETQSNENEELVLKPSTTYVITITNLSGSGGDNASDVEATLFFYEENEG